MTDTISWHAVQNSAGAWNIQVGPGYYDHSIGVFHENEHIGVTGEVLKRHAMIAAAAPELLEAASKVLVAWQKLAEALPQDNRIEDVEFDEIVDLRTAVGRALGIEGWEVTTHLIRQSQAIANRKISAEARI